MNTDNRFAINGSKILPVHQQRLACIYVRQSSFKQVRENTESQVYQYRLQERAKGLGWSESHLSSRGAYAAPEVREGCAPDVCAINAPTRSNKLVKEGKT